MEATMSDEAVRYEAKDQVGFLTLSRPDGRNAMTGELLDAFSVAARAARADRAVRCVVLTGEGNCFSAGADLNAGLQLGEPSSLPHERSYAMYRSFLEVLDIEVPVIAALNGHAVGGGFGLTLLADIRIARRDARYGANFARLGLHSGLGIGYLLPRLVGLSSASELLYTGRLIGGDEGARMGLFSRALPGDEVLPAATALALEIAAAAPMAVRSMKASMRAGLAWTVREAARAEAALQAETLGTEDAKEGMAALLAKRPPVFRGA
jgi:enoyl-CoA hydratase/carnithine racemase